MRKLTQKERKHLQTARDQFLDSLKTRINVYIWTEDLDAINRLFAQVEILGAYEQLKIIRDKGLEKEFEAIIDKAGQIVVPDSTKGEKE